MDGFPDLPDLSALITFDENLRETPTDRAALEAARETAVKRLPALAEEEDGQALLWILGYLGNVCRVLGKAGEAVRYLQEAVALAGVTRNPNAALANVIRLGEAYKYSGNHPVAERLFRYVLAETAPAHPYRDFALQHLGKCLMDDGRYTEAVPFLEEALEIRRRKKDAALVQSTTRALALVQTHSSHENR